MSVTGKSLVLALGLFLSAAGHAGYGDIGIGFKNANIHYHGEDMQSYYPGGHGYYYRERPNVIITVPIQRHYRRRCEEIEVCNSYDECWLERSC